MTYDANVELRKWISQKNGVVKDWGQKSGELLSAFAGRGFSKPTGEAESLLSLMGEDFKNKLTELSAKIMVESMQVGVEDTEHENSITIGNYRLSIESQIDALLQTFIVEKEELNTFYTNKKEVWARVQNELDAREVILIEGRQAIENSLEDLDLQLIEARRTPFSKQLLLLEEQVITANTKLEIIPHLQNILLEEQKLVASKIVTLDKTETLIPPQEELLVLLLDKVNADIKTTEELTDLVPIREDIVVDQENLITKREETLNARDLIRVDRELLQVSQRALQYDKKKTAESIKAVLLDQEEAIKEEKSALEEEERNILKGENRISAEKLVVSAREDLASEVEDLAGERDSLAIEQVDSINEQLSDLEEANNLQIDLIEERIASEEEIAGEELSEILSKRLALAKLSDTLDSTIHSNSIALIEKEDAISEDVTNTGLDTLDEVLLIESDIEFVRRELKSLIQEKELTSRSDLVIVEVDSDKDTLDRVGFYQRATTTVEAKLRSLAEVTATVAHTISS
jgi:hypothetical protein